MASSLKIGKLGKKAVEASFAYVTRTPGHACDWGPLYPNCGPSLVCPPCRYMVQWPGARILRRQELDAFLAQALSPKLYEPDQLQELKVTDTSFLILLILEPCSGVKGQLTSPGS